MRLGGFETPTLRLTARRSYRLLHFSYKHFMQTELIAFSYRKNMFSKLYRFYARLSNFMHTIAFFSLNFPKENKNDVGYGCKDKKYVNFLYSKIRFGT